MKVLICGAGGVGSYLIRNLSEALKADIRGIREIEPLQVKVFDGDAVEEKNLMYANYDIEDLGQPKVASIKQRYSFDVENTFVDEALVKKIIEEYDFVILCVDNNDIRKLFYESGINFLDLRATGKFISAFLVVRKSPEYQQYLDGREGASSCQFQHDIDSRTIRFGNRVVAELGLSMLQDYLLGDEIYKEKIFSL